MRHANNILAHILENELRNITQLTKQCLLVYYGPITAATKSDFLQQVSGYGSSYLTENLTIVLQTHGGSAEYAEFLVQVIRTNWSGEVTFVIPDLAMSAGTIFSMSGDRILMSNSSRLGPTDPQVWNGRRWVPALGYLDEVDYLVEQVAIEQASGKGFNQAYGVLLSKIDLAELRHFREARALSDELLKKWLSTYKFKDWNVHSSTGLPVTASEKEERAEEIASKLSSNKKWHSHSRFISKEVLRTDINLKIEDLETELDSRLYPLIMRSHEYIQELVASLSQEYFVKLYPYSPSDEK